MDFLGGASVKNPLPMQWTQVPNVVWEKSTYHGAAKPVPPATEPSL